MSPPPNKSDEIQSVATRHWKTARRQEWTSPLSQERKQQDTTPSQHTIRKNGAAAGAILIATTRTKTTGNESRDKGYKDQ